MKRRPVMVAASVCALAIAIERLRAACRALDSDSPFCGRWDTHLPPDHAETCNDPTLLVFGDVADAAS